MILKRYDVILKTVKFLKSEKKKKKKKVLPIESFPKKKKKYQLTSTR